MSDRIGPSFFSELQAAGLTCVSSFQNASGDITFFQGTSEEEKVKTQAVLAKHDPTKPAPPIVPDMVTNYQARAALVSAGLFAKADAAIRGADQTVAANQLALQAWDYANNFYRDSAFISGVGSTLGLKPADIDALFVSAGAVQ